MKHDKNNHNVDSHLDKSEIASGRIIGRKISQYTIVGFLGQGAMATVYKAKDATGLEVALKLLIEGPAVDHRAIKRFKTEAQASKTLRKHPHAITVYETGEEGEVHYIAMECVGNGQTLSDIMAEQKLSVEEAVNIAVQIASALEYAHEKRIIHRDVKPGNIMINEFGQAVLTDFGLVKSTDAVVATYTATGAVMGTPVYMCPEQTRGEKTTVQYDIYSLGIVLYEMLAKRSPFGVKEGEVIADLFHKIRQASIPSPRKFNKQITKRLEAIVLKATEKSPKDRYRTMSDFLRDLHHFQEGKVVAARKPSVFEYFERNIRRHWLIAFSVLTMLTVVAGLIYFFRTELRQQQLKFLLSKVKVMTSQQSLPHVIPQNVLLKPGDELFRKGEYQQALAIYQDIADHYDKKEITSAAKYKMGLCYQKLGQVDRAISIFSGIREQDQTSDLAKLTTVEMAVCLLHNNNLEDAAREVSVIRDSKTPVEVKEKLVRFYQHLGNAYRSRKSHSQAEKAYLNSIKIAESIPIDRFSVISRLYLARNSAEEGRIDEAALEFEKIVELYPEQRWHAAWALLDLGNVYLRKGNVKESRRLYKKLTSEYDNQVWQFEMAMLMLRQIGTGEFEQKIDNLHKKFWNDAYYALGLRFLIEKNYSQAEKFFHKCLKVSKDDEWPAKIVPQQLKVLQDLQL